jgi:hypothetical protein
MGMGPFFTLLAGLNLITTGCAAVQILRHRKLSREMIRVASMAGTAAAAGSAPGSSGSSEEDVESSSAAAATAKA